MDRKRYAGPSRPENDFDINSSCNAIGRPFNHCSEQRRMMGSTQITGTDLTKEQGEGIRIGTDHETRGREKNQMKVGWSYDCKIRVSSAVSGIGSGSS